MFLGPNSFKFFQILSNSSKFFQTHDTVSSRAQHILKQYRNFKRMGKYWNPEKQRHANGANSAEDSAPYCIHELSRGDEVFLRRSPSPGCLFSGVCVCFIAQTVPDQTGESLRGMLSDKTCSAPQKKYACVCVC